MRSTASRSVLDIGIRSGKVSTRPELRKTPFMAIEVSRPGTGTAATPVSRIRRSLALPAPANTWAPRLIQ